MTDRVRLEKFLGMLGSAFDGERANAAAMILKMAQSQKLTIVELCMGQPNSSSSGASQGEVYWRAQYNTTRLKADRLEREVETLKKELLAKKEGNKRDFNNAGQQQQRPSGMSPEQLHKIALDMHQRQSPLLNDWERGFLKTMSAWNDPSYLSPKQLNTILRIHEKVSAAV